MNKFRISVKKLEGKLDEDNLSKYNSVKNELDKIYNHIAGGTRIRSKCDWYEQGEKSTLFFGLEKQWGSQNTIKKLTVDNKEITENKSEWSQLSFLFMLFGIKVSSFKIQKSFMCFK